MQFRYGRQTPFEDTLRAVNQARDKGASSWLNALPIKSQGFALNKGEFRDALNIRYSRPIKDLPSTCPVDVFFTTDTNIIQIHVKPTSIRKKSFTSTVNTTSSFIIGKDTNITVGRRHRLQRLIKRGRVSAITGSRLRLLFYLFMY